MKVPGEDRIIVEEIEEIYVEPANMSETHIKNTGSKGDLREWKKRARR